MIAVWPLGRRAAPLPLLRLLWIAGFLTAGGLVALKVTVSVHQLAISAAPSPPDAAADPNMAPPPALDWSNLPAPAAGHDSAVTDEIVAAGGATDPTPPDADAPDRRQASGGDRLTTTAPFDPRAPLAVEAPATRALPLDPERLTSSELDVLQSLAGRRAELDRRAADLDQRAALVAAAEARLEAQMEQLGALRTEIAARIEQHDEAEDAKLTSLVKIYETMKPKAAAEIFDRLEMPVLLPVIARMRAVKSSDVLARMDPVKAKQVTAALAGRIDRLREAEGG